MSELRVKSLYVSGFPPEDAEDEEQPDRVDQNDKEPYNSSPSSDGPSPPVGHEGDEGSSGESSSSAKPRRRTFVHRCLTRTGCHGLLARMPERWPRTFWFLYGVVGPLWMLILIASLCGYGLSRTESPLEIQRNDEKLRAAFLAARALDIFALLGSLTPAICYKAYTQNQTFIDLFPKIVQSDRGDYQKCPELYSHLSQLQASTTSFLVGETAPPATMAAANNSPMSVNDTLTAMEFMMKCGQTITENVREIIQHRSACVLDKQDLWDVGVLRPNDLTFNWNRCANATVSDPILGLPLQPRDFEPFHPEEQREYYTSVWLDQVHRINASIYNQTVPPNATASQSLMARLDAEIQATGEATGREACLVNFQSGGWFFFTVMTTVGYGNQAPATAAGQAMLYTVGFLSMIVFARVATRAGRITSILFDDLTRKMRLGRRRLSHPLLAPLFWGALYWAWLVLIALYTGNWKRQRMRQDFSFAQSYWFAYISTTTVGLGDIFLEPELLVTQDLLVYSLLFLIGFVFLAAFLGTLGNVCNGLLQSAGGKALEESLADTYLCCGHAVVRAGARFSTTSVAHPAAARWPRSLHVHRNRNMGDNNQHH